MREAIIGICPCKGCNDRKVKCHSECIKYRTWENANEKARDQEYKTRETYKPRTLGPQARNVLKKHNKSLVSL